MPRKPIGERPMTDAERQARCRAARESGTPAVRIRRPLDHRSRAKRWRDAVAELTTLQGQYAAWLEALPENLQDSATAETCRRSATSTSLNSRRSFRPAASAEIDPRDVRSAREPVLQKPRLTDQRRLHLTEPRSPRLRNPDPMWTAPWQALSSATSLWRLRSYVRPVDASRNPLAMMLSASSGFSSAPRARSAGRGTECPGRRFAGSPSPHCALAKLLSRVQRDCLDQPTDAGSRR